jgi:hypothetical protein
VEDDPPYIYLTPPRCVTRSHSNADSAIICAIDPRSTPAASNPLLVVVVAVMAEGAGWYELDDFVAPLILPTEERRTADPSLSTAAQRQSKHAEELEAKRAIVPRPPAVAYEVPYALHYVPKTSSSPGDCVTYGQLRSRLLYTDLVR